MPFAEDSYTGNGSTKEFNISFAYIEEGHIKVALNEVATTAFTVDTSTSPKKVVMNTLASETSTQTTTGAPKSGVAVLVFRDTPLNNALVDYTDGSTLIADDLDKSNQQFLFLLQEQDDEQAANIQSTLAGQDAQNKKIINVADPTAAQHATTKNYVDSNFQPLDAELTELATMSSGTASALADLSQAETQILDGATVTTSELNTLDGITASTAELNKLDGVTASTEELNRLDGLTSTTAELNVLDGVTATAAEINKLDGVTASTAELNKLDGVTASTAEINKLDGLTPTTAELNFVDGVTSAIQNQIDGKQPLDSELTELATMPATTASALADLTQAEVQVLDGATLSTTELNKLDGVTSTTSELNILDGVTANASELNVTDGLTASTSELNQLDGKTISGTLTPANTNDIPTSSAVNTFVSGLLNALGGFVAIPNETSFPTTNPDPSDNAGTVVSIADAGGIVVDAAGASTTSRTTGNVTVTITGFPTSLRNSTLAAGLGLQVQTTTTLNTYTYHKLIAKETDITQLSDDINDFNARYRVSDNAPTTDLDEGDLWYDKTANKMKVYDTSTSAWKEVQSVGNFFINTLSSSSGTGGGSATFNGSAYRFTLSNAGANAQQMLVSVNGVIQKPNSGTSQPSEGFAIQNNDIIFAAAPASGASHFIVTLGSTVNIGQPSNNTVDTSELVDGAVTNAKVSSSAAIASSKLAKPIDFADDERARFGSSQDLQIYHDAANSALLNITGDLYIINGADDKDILLQSDNGSGGTTTYVLCDGSTGSAKLNYLGSEKLQTKSDGILVQGEVQADSLDINGAADISGNVVLHNHLDLQDDNHIRLGVGDDLKIYHDGSNSYIKDGGTGSLKIQGTNLLLESAAGEAYIFCTADGSTKVYHNNSKKLETKSDGIDVTGEVQCDSLDVDGAALFDGNVTLNGAATDHAFNVKGIAALEATNSTNDWLAYTYTDNTFRLNYNGAGSDEVTITNDGNVGIGETSPDTRLHLKQSTTGATGIFIQNSNGATNSSADLYFGNWNGSSTSTPQARLQAINKNSNTAATDLAFSTYSGNSTGERMRILADGGLTFNGDTAAANALNDYEEGTHNTVVTMTGDTSFSYSARTLAYTKIGRVVHVTGRLFVANTGGSTFEFTLPFTSGNGNQFETSNEMQIIRGNDGYTFRINPNTSFARLQNDGSNTGIGSNDPHINVNLTYFTA